MKKQDIMYCAGCHRRISELVPLGKSIDGVAGALYADDGKYMCEDCGTRHNDEIAEDEE